MHIEDVQIGDANLGTYLPHALLQIWGRTFGVHKCMRKVRPPICMGRAEPA